jgi:hypothetical protein
VVSLFEEFGMHLGRNRANRTTGATGAVVPETKLLVFLRD